MPSAAAIFVSTFIPGIQREMLWVIVTSYWRWLTTRATDDPRLTINNLLRYLLNYNHYIFSIFTSSNSGKKCTFKCNMCNNRNRFTVFLKVLRYFPVWIKRKIYIYRKYLDCVCVLDMWDNFNHNWYHLRRHFQIPESFEVFLKTVIKLL